MPCGIRVANVFILKELLANPAEGTVLGRARLVGAKGIGATRARPRKKSKQRLQRDAELVHAGIAIQQVVWIVGTESPTDLAAGTNVTLGGGSPRAKLQVLVAKELRSAPDCVDARQRIVAPRFGIAVGQDRPDPEVFIEVVRDATGEQIRARHYGRG